MTPEEWSKILDDMGVCPSPDEIVAMIRQAVAWETEECAKVVRDLVDHWRNTQSVEVVAALEKAAEAIRERILQ